MNKIITLLVYYLINLLLHLLINFLEILAGAKELFMPKK